MQLNRLLTLHSADEAVGILILWLCPGPLLGGKNVTERKYGKEESGAMDLRALHMTRFEAAKAGILVGNGDANSQAPQIRLHTTE